MRLWSVHPRYLDRQALTACWREALLAQSIFARVGGGGGYAHHPQVERFSAQRAPLEAIGAFLSALADEADARGYHFAREKISCPVRVDHIPVSTGQLAYEWTHLMAKLARRSPDVARRWARVTQPEPHPLFTTVEGPIASWERPKVG